MDTATDRLMYKSSWYWNVTPRSLCTALHSVHWYQQNKDTDRQTDNQRWTDRQAYIHTDKGVYIVTDHARVVVHGNRKLRRELIICGDSHSRV